VISVGLDVGKVSIEYLPRPDGAAYAFIGELASEASCAGDGNAFDSYLRDEMERRANEFVEDRLRLPGITQQEVEAGRKVIMDWIASLPWDEDNYLTLTFNS
jgi:hypothetical protein